MLEAASSPGSESVSACLRRAEIHLAQCGVASARLDAELLLADVLGTDRARLRVDAARPLGLSAYERYARLVERRGEREPLQYIRGRQEFFSRDFVVDRSVLVPRPETEILVETALAKARSFTRPSIADVGSGSGAIAVTLALEHPQARIVATDVSVDAIRVGRANAERLGAAPRVEFRCGDLLMPCAGESFDLVVSNPPYVASAEIQSLEPEVRDHEPRIALDGGPDGLSVYYQLAQAASGALRPAGALVLEVGIGQHKAVEAIFAAAGFAACEVRRDLAGIERVLTIEHVRAARG